MTTIPPAATAKEALPPPTPLMSIRFTFERKEWPLHQLVGNVKDEVQKSQKSIKSYLEKPMRRALKRGQQRLDIGKPPPGIPDWPTLTKRARLGPVSSDLATAKRPIESLDASVFNAAFVLRETDDRKQQRQELMNIIAAVLQGISDMSWRGWRNPFATEITRENHIQLGLAEYFDVIAEAMSIPQIERRVDAGTYRTFDDFQEDVSLMVKNAQEFNRPGDPVHGMAGELWDKFLELKKANVRAR